MVHSLQRKQWEEFANLEYLVIFYENNPLSAINETMLAINETMCNSKTVWNFNRR